MKRYRWLLGLSIFLSLISACAPFGELTIDQSIELTVEVIEADLSATVEALQDEIGAAENASQVANLPPPPEITQRDATLLELFGEYTDTNHWESANDYTSSTVEEGVLKVKIIEAGWTYNYQWKEQYSDTIMSIEARQIGGIPGDGIMSVTCRGNDDKNEYAFYISNDGWYRISKQVDGEWIILVDWKSNAAINQGAAWNTIQASCIGTTLSMWVNDTFLVSVEDKSLQTGFVGFAGGTLESNKTNFEFDNFKFKTP